MQLFESPDNPMPPDPLSGAVRTPDGINLRYARWRTLRPPAKGTIVLLHGRTEYIEKMYETVSDLRGMGFEVLTFDWRGQGGSDRLLGDRRRGHVDSFRQYVTDLDTVMNEVVLPDCRAPFFILAHSTGGLVALLAAPGLGNRIERMVLTSPLIRFGETALPQPALKVLAGLMCTFGLGTLPLSRRANPHAEQRFANNRLTSDTRRFTRNVDFAAGHPELGIAGPTAAWIFAACQAMDIVDDPDFIASIAVPTLLVAAGNDKVVSTRAIEELGLRMRSGRTVTVAGARHELLQERDVYRQQLLAAVAAFIPGTSPVA
ncbi:MAG: lysophospholipase [Alphaproteobacteria bacterium]|nr:MAG: lysophospholipase [Alphaproteobacteria bacterium]